MPLSVFRKLGLGVVTPTTVSLQLSNRSIKYPHGVIEDVFVKVDKVYLSAYFIILDMEKDREIPLNLERPFLAMGKTIIDVQQGKLTIRVQDEEITLKVFEAMKYPMDNEDCFSIDIVEKLTMETFREGHPMLSLEACIIHFDTNTKKDHEKSECVNYLEATIEFSKKEDFHGADTSFIYTSAFHTRTIEA